MYETGASKPARIELGGRYVQLRPLRRSDARHLWDAGAGTVDLWTWMSSGPFHDFAEFEQYLAAFALNDDPLPYAIVDLQSERPTGFFSLMRIEPKHRVIEVGHVLYTPRLQRTRGATEAQYLLAQYAFETLGYRRYEWKCNALNGPSRRAALRLGFEFEGIFRQHMIIKGENRDTAWYSMLDAEWPERKRRFEAWLRPENFDADGNQLKDLRSPDLKRL